MTIPTWQQRLDAMDHSKGTTNVMRQNAMKAEIFALRRALREQKTRAERAKEKAEEWKAHANRYQKLAASRARP